MDQVERAVQVLMHDGLVVSDRLNGSSRDAALPDA